MPDGLYERDALAWAEHQAGLLRRLAGRPGCAALAGGGCGIPGRGTAEFHAIHATADRPGCPVPGCARANRPARRRCSDGLAGALSVCIGGLGGGTSGYPHAGFADGSRGRGLIRGQQALDDAAAFGAVGRAFGGAAGFGDGAAGVQAAAGWDVGRVGQDVAEP